MGEFDRRQMLKTTGMGIGVALGVGTTSASRGTGDTSKATTESTVLTTFQATAGQGFITINANDPTADKIEFSGADIEGDVQINGEIYDDGTWQSTLVDFPEIDPAEIADGIDQLPDDVEADIQINVPPIEGAFLPEMGLITAPLTLGIDVSARAFGQTLIDITAAPSADLTTGTSGGMTGAVPTFDGGTGTVSLVGNRFPIEATGNSLADDQLGLPAPAGRNWLKLDLNMEIADPAALDGTPDDVLDTARLGGIVPPRDLDGDSLHEDVRGDGRVDIFDVQALFANMDSPDVQDNAAAFNFSETDPNEVTVADVQALFDRL
jgi:PKD repeat protein